MAISDEEAKAVQEVAKASGPVVALVRDAGHALVNSTVASIPADLIGAAGGDWLHEARRRNKARMEAKTAAILESIDRARLTEPSPSVVLPLLEAAMDESREELQDLWANLLANAMIDGGFMVRRDFFVTLKAMEPIDAVVLDVFAATESDSSAEPYAQLAKIQDALRERQVAEWNYTYALEASLDTLKAGRCLTIMQSHNVWRLTAYGRTFLNACHVEWVTSAGSPGRATAGATDRQV
jgi:hypothetical protein